MPSWIGGKGVNITAWTPQHGIFLSGCIIHHMCTGCITCDAETYATWSHSGICPKTSYCIDHAPMGYCLQLNDLSIHSFIQLFTHSFIIHALTHALICLFIHSFVHSFIHSFIHAFIHSFIHSFIHAFIHSPQRKLS